MKRILAEHTSTRTSPTSPLFPVPLEITLGQEALDAVRGVADRCEGVQLHLAPEGYGARGRLTIGTLVLDFLPLVHPGFQRQTSEAKRPDWAAAFRKWQDSLSKS